MRNSWERERTSLLGTVRPLSTWLFAQDQQVSRELNVHATK